MSNGKDQKWLETYFEEKEVPFNVLTVQVNGETHLINTEVVIDLILQAPEHEASVIAPMIRKIDFHNGKLEPFLEHLAKCFIQTRHVKVE